MMYGRINAVTITDINVRMKSIQPSLPNNSLDKNFSSKSIIYPILLFKIFGLQQLGIVKRQMVILTSQKFLEIKFSFFFPLEKVAAAKILFSTSYLHKRYGISHATHDDGQIPMNAEEFAMNESPISKGTKHMKLNFYMPTDVPQYTGGRRDIHFRFVTRQVENKRMLRKYHKKQSEYRAEHPLKYSLNPYMEAAKCRTLDNFMEVKTQ
jgi:hypothetical protein